MLNIIICDDEEVTRRKISNHLKTISNKHDLDINIPLSTDNPDSVLNFLKNNKADIILIDIDLKLDNTDGIKLGNDIRKFDSNIIIIFLSARMDRILNIFTCTPFDFIPKPSFYPQIEETILRAINCKENLPHGNFIKIKNSVINIDEVIYIEKQLVKSVFVTTSNNIEVSISFLELNSCLPDNFIQVAKSYIINKNYILSINESSKQIILTNNFSIKYSNKYISNLGGKILCNN